MKFVLDTSAYSEFNRGRQALRQWFHTKHTILVPLVVIGELHGGFALGDRREENERLLRQFLDSANVETVTLTEVTAQLYADVYCSLRQKGKALGTNDIWIAALTLEHKVPLLTCDNDFVHITDLRLLKSGN